MFCPFDCWDACQLKTENGKRKIKAEGITTYLCWKLNNYFNFPTEKSPKFNGKNIMLNKVLHKFTTILKSTEPKKVLFIKGSGNMGLMQNVTKLFFEKYGATFAVGSTCDGIGEKGIKKSRGKSLILPIWIIKNAKNIIIWGRNPYVTNIHLLPLIKNKFIVTIDAINTKTAKNSDFFIQVKPNSDYYLAALLSQMTMERNLVKKDDGLDFEKFKKIVFSYSKNELIEKSGVNKKQAEKLFEIITEGAVVLTGLGISKCKECYKTAWAVDSLFYMLDYFGKKDRGVAYLGSSSFGINNPFKINHKNKVALFDVNLDNFDVVFIQGANPLVSFVNRDKWKKLKEKKLIVFGKYYDETAKIANLFIPTKDFYEKKDVRGSYFHEYVLTMENVKWKMENEPCSSGCLKNGHDERISEYEFTKYLFNEFGFGELKKEDEYIREILDSNLEKINDNVYKKKVFDKPPYSEGFFTKDKKFHFLTELFERNEKEFEIITAKEAKALNSQFKKDENIYINPESKNIMLNWVKKNINKNSIKYDKNIPQNIIYTKGGTVINEILKAKGENAYYEIQ
ncbi:molybdopterin-dependent oxidoreductase [Lebetimonas sp. JH292]|uniref:molybdopterin-dependent oxidoreductase n=1 Tax=Lebetimonas sp. JH292 TaxID=990068 RepID=UPI0004633BCF|nr:molybdopterin-dependent oxidoreductase [Lebetimonas sp. JH292]